MSLEPDPRDPDGPAPPAFNFTFDPTLATYDTPMETYLASHPEFDAIAAGALVFSREPATGARRLLLLQRAAHDSMPLRWEIPGGACDFDDPSLLHGLARELWEESRLMLRHVSALVTLGIGAPNLGKGSQDGAVFFSRRGKRIIKYSFLVEVEEPAEVVLDPNEHAQFLWATEEQFREGRAADVELNMTTDQQAATIREAFRLASQ
ncbi:nudix domain-containingprotein [Purpureocillium lavendulum]|uniref:Nudix domain-containingprotein n=1 Tax=Purpureocillium lavendulum TaxID=1247861 RepID=A0AB34FSU6_9HYPO|nr:nudix domain-containingprotein [Purpureocillium lavendulum]